MDKIEQIDQKIHRLQAEKKRLKKRKESAERKKRNHALIVVGATLMTHFSPEINDKIINGSDEEIATWVNSLFVKK